MSRAMIGQPSSHARSARWLLATAALAALFGLIALGLSRDRAPSIASRARGGAVSGQDGVKRAPSRAEPVASAALPAVVSREPSTGSAPGEPSRAEREAQIAEEVRKLPALRAAFQREAPDSTAPAAEQELRSIFEARPHADTIFRNARCTRSVCRVELRWSPEITQPYNEALLEAVLAFSRDISLEPDVTLGGPEMPIPMTLYIARPGHSVESLVAEQLALRLAGP